MGVKRGALLWAPLAVFALLVVVVAAGLWRPADRTVRSALIGEPLPAVPLPPLLPGKPGLATGDAARKPGEPYLLNVFASWCIPCAAEAPQLMRLKAMGVPVEAVAVRDTPQAVAAFLARYGDPYRAIGNDARGRLQLALGSSGVPETFVVDAHGRIAFQQVGDIRPEDVAAIAERVRAAR